MNIHEIISEQRTQEGWVSAGVRALTRSGAAATKAAGKSARAVKAAEMVASHYGSQTMKLLYAVDIVKEVINYNLKVSALDKSANDYEEKLRTIRGQFIVAVLGPKVAMWVGNKLLLTKIFNFLPWILQKFGAPGAAAITRQLSFKGAEAAMLLWWSTDAGKQWLTDTFGAMITGVGTVPEIAGSVLGAAKAVAQVATGTGNAAELNKQRAAGVPGSEPTVDPNDPMSIMGKAVGGTFADPFKGTSRAGSTL
jgi:hypothetical protein